jgi:aspartyl-tRNA(Asn)/glutamyl-tRNA(Gln) amidotransferase subunit A
MAMNPFSDLNELAGALASGQSSAVELARVYLDRIARGNATLHAYVSVDDESVLKQAQAADARRASGHCLGPLDGLPIAVKDLCEIEGQVSTCGSAAWRERRSATTATVVERLRMAGMVVLGKTHMVEFAFGGWGVNPLMGTPRNPWDLAVHRIPGGSSSGSGVAVAAGLAPAAIGSDTGGSVRIPASLTGITGLKTTVGLISRHAVLPLSTTLDSIGPMTRTVADAALLTRALAGSDLRDPATMTAPLIEFITALEASADLAGARIVVLPENQFPIDVHPEVVAVFRDAQRVLRELGAHVLERRFPFDFDDLMRRNGQLIAAEAWAIHRAYIEEGSMPFGPAVRGRVLGGKAISAADYIDALSHHRRACLTWHRWMQDADALLTPTLPFPACTLGDVDERATPLAAFTRAGNYLGSCALSLPGGFSRDGMPIGVQLMAKPFDEATLIRIGRAFQCASDWHLRKPDLEPLFGPA